MTTTKKQPILRRPVFFGLLFALAILVSYLIVNWPMLSQQASYALGGASDPEVPLTTDAIIIPEIGVAAPIVWASEDNEERLQTQLLEGVVHHPTTTLPGEPGNGVYIGHSSNYWWEESDYNTVFGLLDKLETGDTVILRYQGSDYSYTVKEKKVVAKDAPEIFTGNETEEITLVTCWPLGTDWQNFIIKAVPSK
ncbi:sortase [Patescibacteria group bacterium]